MRIKDISRVLGVRSNQLMGYGLVIGLNGTGDSRQAIFTTQAVSNMLEHFGISVDSQDIRLRNVAGVMVTCDLPAFVKNGDRVDVVVSSLGDARSLEGGMLLLTQLQGPDGKTYAVAQGPVSIGGRSGSGMRSQSNFPTVARIPEGAIIEREVPTTFADVGSGTVAVTLNQPDFTTASRVAAAINARLGEGVASAVDGATVRVKIPPGYSQDAVGLVAAIEELMVKADTVARVAINERTGTVVIGGNVCLLPAAVAHGNLRVQVGGGSGSPGAFSAAEPAPASGGGPAPARPMTLGGPGAAAGITAGGSNAAVSVTPSGPGAAISIIPGGTVDVLVAALNAIGASPRDIIAILQALKSAGSLLAEVEIL